jgi:phage head maturation protease
MYHGKRVGSASIDEDGNFQNAELSNSTELGEDVLQLIRVGAMESLSIAPVLIPARPAFGTGISDYSLRNRPGNVFDESRDQEPTAG